MMKGRQSGMPEADQWSSFFDPDCVVSTLTGDRLHGDVVDFGCGYGLFTEAIARRTTGTVFALDIEAEMVGYTRRRVARAGLRNVVAERRDFLADGCGRPAESLSHALLFNILHIEQPVRLLRETFRALKPEGEVSIIHWNHDPSTPRGPSMDIRPRPDQCRRWAEEAGFRFIKSDPLDCCPFHYGLLMHKPIANNRLGVSRQRLSCARHPRR